MKNVQNLGCTACGRSMMAKVGFFFIYFHDLYAAVLEDFVASVCNFSLYLWDLNGKSKGKQRFDWPRNLPENIETNNIRISYGATCPNGDLLMADLGNDVVFKRKVDGSVILLTGHPMYHLKKEMV